MWPFARSFSILICILALFLTQTSSVGAAELFQLKVLTLNSEEHPRGPDSRTSSTEFAQKFYDSGAQVIFLQEALFTAQKADALQKVFLENGSSQRVYYTWGRYFQNKAELGIISLFPMKGVLADPGLPRAVYLTNPDNLRITLDPNPEQMMHQYMRGVVSAVVTTPVGDIRVHSTHAQECYGINDWILPFAKKLSGETLATPVIVGGDMNISSVQMANTSQKQSCTPLFNQLFQVSCLQDTENGAVLDASCPTTVNRAKGFPDSDGQVIDHIAVSRSLGASSFSYAVLQGEQFDISDHWPVMVTLTIPTRTGEHIRGDFNNDGGVTSADVQLLVRALNTTNATYNLTGSTPLVDLYDYNEMLKLIKR